MDPDATLKQIAKSTTHKEADDLCQTLQNWILNGGYHPDWRKSPSGKYRYLRFIREGTTHGLSSVPR